MHSTSKSKTALPWLMVSCLVVIIDQLSKIWALHHLPYRQAVPLFQWLNWTLVFNSGAAFSFLGNAAGWQVYFFCGISLLIAILFIIWLARMPRYFFWRGLGVGLIIGGAIGNFIDRVRLNYVIDFIDFHIAHWHFATFNIADSAISVGAFFLILSLLFSKK